MNWTKPTRHRVYCAVCAACIVALGLIWRSDHPSLPPFLRKYGGDALWAALVFNLVALVKPLWSSFHVGIWAFGIACAVGISQLYHAPWIDALRGTRLGALILGSTFNWPDIPAYAVGVALAMILAFRARHQH